MLAQLPRSQRILSESVLFVSCSRIVFAFCPPSVFICLCLLPLFPSFPQAFFPGPTHLCLIGASYPLVYLSPHPLTLCTTFSSLHSPVLSSLILLVMCLTQFTKHLRQIFCRIAWTVLPNLSDVTADLKRLLSNIVPATFCQIGSLNVGSGLFTWNL